jgi:hypothetical protein
MDLNMMQNPFWLLLYWVLGAQPARRDKEDLTLRDPSGPKLFAPVLSDLDDIWVLVSMIDLYDEVREWRRWQGVFPIRKAIHSPQ